ncbi:MAG: arginine--tRNA ligase, partial [Spirochaetaceae bacterium]|nr:arginine--tRNA ligase [Spirochaetaceae bacterium]
MKDIKELWTGKVLSVLNNMADTAGISSENFVDRLSVGKPPKSDMGDLSFPLFPFAKDFKKAPVELAAGIAVELGGEKSGVSVAGPYLNVRIDRAGAISRLLENIKSTGKTWGSGNELSGRKVMVEFSSPNTNKPLHLGHLRNDILGESCARIMAARGADVQKVNLVNDRGVHICKSMLAY